MTPVEEGVVDDPKKYDWSGHNFLAAEKESPVPLDLLDLYANLGKNQNERCIGYRALALNYQGLDVDLLNQRVAVLGDEAFKKRIKEKKQE